jgi:hypothetical protein
MNKPQLEKCSFQFSQESNVNGSTYDMELLDISCESSLGIDNDRECFYVLKTEGWSIDDLSDLQELIDRISKVIKGGEDESKKGK